MDCDEVGVVSDDTAWGEGGRVLDVGEEAVAAVKAGGGMVWVGGFGWCGGWVRRFGFGGHELREGVACLGWRRRS